MKADAEVDFARLLTQATDRMRIAGGPWCRGITANSVMPREPSRPTSISSVTFRVRAVYNEFASSIGRRLKRHKPIGAIVVEKFYHQWT
jgi:hypothetical protein